MLFACELLQKNTSAQLFKANEVLLLYLESVHRFRLLQDGALPVEKMATQAFPFCGSGRRPGILAQELCLPPFSPIPPFAALFPPAGKIIFYLINKIYLHESRKINVNAYFISDLSLHFKFSVLYLMLHKITIK